jgi:hypothetical protein
MPFAEWIPAFAGMTEPGIARISQITPPETATFLPGIGLLYSCIFAERWDKFHSRGWGMNRGEPQEHSYYDSTKNLYELYRR